ncbi:cytochrome b/b6 domain-containing protein [Virgibacillus sp. NKC19-3]|uniref:formate dehydrogenase subunit gamma n=1 Tax=Virgibacillus saliphilus TaxID=2831674 RepID=UPI001C9AA074|nr:cytochrome b/b6 domain-containing protein [Virgibacillus sp. NKC19-3]MBY7142070.1 cytochrome b/b6 domain-containing protein [Virgibacillus sp. NKC19-3]
MSKKRKSLVKRYNRVDMIMHWTVAVGFILAMLTGYAVFFEGTSSLLVNEVGFVIRLVHRIGGVIFVLAPILYFIFSKKRFGFLRAFKWDKSDFGWLKAAPKHYFVGGGDMPPQQKYNTGQKLFYLFAVVFGVLLVVSGFFLWFSWFSPTVGLIMLFIHDVSAVLLTLFFFVHVYLVAFHPDERTSFNAMTTGYMDRGFAKHHHELWYNEVKDEEEKKKQENKEVI